MLELKQLSWVLSKGNILKIMRLVSLATRKNYQVMVGL